MPSENKTTYLKRGEGKALWFLGSLYEVKATGKETDGALAVIEMTVAPAPLPGSPPHVHDCGEAVYILEGTIRYHVDGRIIDAPAGSFLYFRKGAKEWFENPGDKPARMLIMYTPAHFENFFLEAAEPAKSRTLPPPPAGPLDIEKLVALAKKHGTDIEPPPQG